MDELEARVEALERAVTDGDHDLSGLAADGEVSERLAAVEQELDGLTDRVAELEAATQALRGYVGNVRAVNDDVEQRADTALAKVESLEATLDGGTPGEHGRARSDGRADGGGETGRRSTPEPRQGSGGTVADSMGSPDDRAAGSGTDGGPHAGHRGRGRCRACGRRAGSQADRDTEPGSPDGPPTDGQTHDSLDGIFDGGDTGEDGTFERIRRML